MLAALPKQAYRVNGFMTLAVGYVSPELLYLGQCCKGSKIKFECRESAAMLVEQRRCLSCKLFFHKLIWSSQAVRRQINHRFLLHFARWMPASLLSLYFGVSSSPIGSELLLPEWRGSTRKRQHFERTRELVLFVLGLSEKKNSWTDGLNPSLLYIRRYVCYLRSFVRSVLS